MTNHECDSNPMSHKPAESAPDPSETTEPTTNEPAQDTEAERESESEERNGLN